MKPRWGYFEPGDTAVITLRRSWWRRFWLGKGEIVLPQPTTTLIVVDPGDRHTARLSDGQILAAYGQSRFEVYRNGRMVYWQDARR